MPIRSSCLAREKTNDAAIVTEGNVSQAPNSAGSAIPFANDGDLLARIDDLTVWENDYFRWLQEGNAIQSVMSRAEPTRLVLPMHRYMLVALALNPSTRQLLNLGFGVGAVERKLNANFRAINVTSIEVSTTIIRIAKQYFQVSQAQSVEICDAQTFLNETSANYDVVMIDLFSSGRNAACLYNADFYRALRRCVHNDAWVAINIIPASERDLLEILVPLRQNFPTVAMATVPERKNIVLLANATLRDPNFASLNADTMVYGYDVRELARQFILLPRPRPGE